jgi:hypothetical protein
VVGFRVGLRIGGAIRDEVSQLELPLWATQFLSAKVSRNQEVNFSNVFQRGNTVTHSAVSTLLCELIDQTLVEKAVGFESSVVQVPYSQFCGDS